MPAPKPKAHTYFVRQGDAIKIGHSIDPRQRLSNLQIGLPEELEVLAIVPAEVISEGAAHAKFNHLRLRGEWFRADPELLAFIKSIRPVHVKGAEGNPAWSNVPPETRKVLSKLHGIRIKAAGRKEISERVSIMIGCIETMHVPGITPEHREQLRHNLGRATAGLTPLLAEWGRS